MKQYILSLDAGTTSSRAIVFDRGGKVMGLHQKEFTQIYPHPGWVEHDPEELWQSQYEAMLGALKNGGISAEEIAAIGIANQRETTLLWDRNTGKPVYNAIVWQCRRTAPLVEELVKEGLSDYIRHETGLVPDAYFSGTKLSWLLDNVPGARERAEAGELCFGTVDSWLVWKLTGGKSHVTDATNASRTMLYSIRRMDWDDRLLSRLRIPRSVLPKVVDSSGICGEAELEGVKIPIAGMAGDQQAALFGQTCFRRGDAKNTYGTGCFLLMNTGTEICESPNGLIATVASRIGGKVTYAAEGSVFVGGAVIQWLRDELGLLTKSSESEAAALSVPDNGGVYLVPAFTGMGTPYWDMYARGTMVGLTRGANRNHIIRAALEGIAYQVCDVVRVMEQDTGVCLAALKADGGASANRFLMQFQADMLDRKLVCPANRETTALGAAYLAGLAVGLWKDEEEILANAGQADVYLPSSPENRETLLAGWAKAVSRARDWAKEE